MSVITVDFKRSTPHGPPYLSGRNPLEVLHQMLETQLADGQTVRDVARLALSGDEEAVIRLGFFGLRCENAGVVLVSPALFSRALPVTYQNGGLYAFHALGGITPEGEVIGLLPG